MSEDDFDRILEYSDMCDKNGQNAVDDYMEFHDELDNFEVIAKRLDCQEPYCSEWDNEENFLRHIVSECYGLEREMTTSHITSTTKPSDASCLCMSTRWGPTITCSTSSGPQSPSLLLQGSLVRATIILSKSRKYSFC